ncbi:MAG: hypothetical protein JO307_00695 [Bryobacterales bacterium]|nr:hypothetical protein [Bryobacterales bacterium]MBV9396780.1 hypothetical protein [Bryobacterales bacterium]
MLPGGRDARRAEAEASVAGLSLLHDRDLRYHFSLMAKMLYLAAGLAAAALWSFGQDAQPSPAQLAILMKFDLQPPPSVIESMQREVEALFEPAGIKVAWRRVEDNEGTELFPHVVVIRVRGECRTHPATLRELEPLVDNLELAHAAVRNGQALPFAEVQCDRVSAFLRPWRRAEQAASLGVAMGRVIAHELFHMLTNTLTHGDGALSKASVTSQELDVKGDGFSQDELELFKKSVK